MTNIAGEVENLNPNGIDTSQLVAGPGNSAPAHPLFTNEEGEEVSAYGDEQALLIDEDEDEDGLGEDEDDVSELLVMVGAPDGDGFSYFHSDSHFCPLVGIYTQREKKNALSRPESYLVVPSLRKSIPTGLRYRRLYLYTNFDSLDLNFWPVSRPADMRRVDAWTKTARICVEAGRKAWIRVTRENGKYGYVVSKKQPDPPDWVVLFGRYNITLNPDDPESVKRAVNKLVQLGFMDRIITSLEHPVLRARDSV
jgi:hypothetical protein